MSAIDGFVMESKPVAHFGVGAIDQLSGVIRATGAGQVVVVTDDALAYMRCHGRNTEGYLHGRSVAERFNYDYSKEELEEIADRARALDTDAEQVHVMFNNNARELAPKAARGLRTILGQDPGPEA